MPSEKLIISSPLYLYFSLIELICFQSGDFCKFWEYQVQCTSDTTDLHILWQLSELYLLKSSEHHQVRASDGHPCQQTKIRLCVVNPHCTL